MSSRRTHILQGVATLVVGAALLWWVDTEALWAALQAAQWGWVGAAALLVPLNLGLDAGVWRVLLRPIVEAADQRSMRRVLKAVLAGMAAGFFTPARLGEYAGRAFALDADAWTLSLSVFVERMADMAVAVCTGAVAVAVLMAMGDLPSDLPWRLAWGSGASIGIAITGGLLRPAWADALGRRLLPTATALHRRTRFLQQLTPADVRVVLGGALLRYVVYVLQFALLSEAFVGTGVSLGFLMLLGSALFFVKFLAPSFTLMDLGVREGTAALLFQAVALPAAAGVHAALLLFALNLMVPALLGAPIVWRLLSSRAMPAAQSDAASV